MDYSTYRGLYDALATREDIERVAAESGHDKELLLVIHTQRVVRDATKRFYKIKRHAGRYRHQWRSGTTLAQLAQNQNFPPVLMALIVLAEEGISRKKFWRMMDNLEEVESDRLRRELKDVQKADIIYSRQGADIQARRGAWGEEKLFEWLRSQNITFRTEADLKGRFDKTPDVLLNEPMVYDGHRIFWVESKATFGDPEEVRRHARRQLSPYLEIFGDGVVVYWFGYVADVDLRLPEGISITDGSDLA